MTRARAKMTKGNKSFDEARDAFRSSLVAHFRDLASKVDLEINETRLTFAEQGGLFVVASGARQGRAKGDGQDVGLIQITASRENLPPYTKYAKEVPPGSFVVHLARNGSVHLKQVGGQLSVPLHSSQAIPDHKCITEPYIEVRIYVGRICFYLVCDGTWVMPLGCLILWSFVQSHGFYE